MPKGRRFSSEARHFRDSRTGTRVRQVTTNPSIHHHPFFFVPAYDDKMERLIFVSHRTGSPQIFAEVQGDSDGGLLQLTDSPGLGEWSIYPSHDGRYVYFTAGTGAWRVDTANLEEELLADFGHVEMREKGMVGAGMGTTALSWDDRWWALRYSLNGQACLAIIDTTSGSTETILRRDSIGHMQFCPDDNNLLSYAGPLTDRLWIVNRDGTGNRRLYTRNIEKREWITHESWIPGTRELAFADWPHGIRAVHADTLALRRIAGFNAWHPVCNRAGDRMISDTNYPDIGIQIFDPRDAGVPRRTVCFPEASNIGGHWKSPFPYDDGPVEVYAPQHTHPHPGFSPDGKRIVFSSDRSGHAQLYEALLE